MDIIEALQQDIREAREAYRIDRTARAHGRLVSAQGDLATARALLDCGYRPLPGGGWRPSEVAAVAGQSDSNR